MPRLRGIIREADAPNWGELHEAARTPSAHGCVIGAVPSEAGDKRQLYPKPQGATVVFSPR
ncbi:MAG: hypothetical protein ACM3NT_08230 [Methylocystaceae bacterium]